MHAGCGRQELCRRSSELAASSPGKGAARCLAGSLLALTLAAVQVCTPCRSALVVDAKQKTRKVRCPVCDCLCAQEQASSWVVLQGTGCT